jgi:hypothetical protein
LSGHKQGLIVIQLDNVDIRIVVFQLDIMEPKTPEDVYKSHLENSRPPFGGGQVDSARQNLAASFVNGFVNAAFGHDKLLMEDGNKWLYKNKEHGSNIIVSFSFLCYVHLFTLHSNHTKFLESDNFFEMNGHCSH